MIGNQTRIGQVRIVLDILGAVFLLAAVLAALYYWDPSRAYLKRFTAEDEYLYETVEARFRDRDPADYLRIGDPSTLSAVRERVARVIWGPNGLPDGDLPADVVRDFHVRVEPGAGDCDMSRFEPYLRVQLLKLSCETGKYTAWENLEGIDELRTIVGYSYESSIAYFRPKRPNSVLVVYQHGFAGTYHAQYRNLQRLVAEGFTVAAANLPKYGDNQCSGAEQSLWCEVAAGVFSVPYPLRVFFSPLAEAINFALREGHVRHVAMIGFSGGAWITSVMAAVDPRIARSYPVAGVMPFYLRRDKEWPPNQVYPPLMEAAGMLDLFVLGASGVGRRQVQFFNRYDRCCYNGPRPLMYEETVRTAVRQSGGGAFDVVIDETHARHKVSRWTLGRIVDDLRQPWDQ